MCYTAFSNKKRDWTSADLGGGPLINSFWISSAELTVAGCGAGQPLPSGVVLHPEDLHTLVLPYAQVQLSSAAPVVPNPGRVEDLVLPLQLRTGEGRNERGSWSVCVENIHTTLFKPWIT